MPTVESRARFIASIAPTRSAVRRPPRRSRVRSPPASSTDRSSSRAVARSLSTPNRSGVDGGIGVRQAAVQLPALDKPFGIATVFVDQTPGVRPAALRAAIIVRQARKVVAAVDAEWLGAGAGGAAPNIGGESDRDRNHEREQLQPEQQQHSA